MLYISRWSTPLVNQIRYESHVTSAREIADEIFTGTASERPLHWLPPLVPNPVSLEFRSPHSLLQFDPDILFDVDVDVGLGELPGDVDEHTGEHADTSTFCVDDNSDVNEDILDALTLEDPQMEVEEENPVGSVAMLWEIQVSSRTFLKSRCVKFC
jgi:hypothetical protein